MSSTANIRNFNQLSITLKHCKNSKNKKNLAKIQNCLTRRGGGYPIISYTIYTFL